MNESKNILLVMRHAESAPATDWMDDHERTLTNLGRRQPRIIAKRLDDLQISIEQALVSDAERTRKTFELLMENKDKKECCEFRPELYNATLHTILTTLSKGVSNTGTTLVLAHCPGVDELTRYLTGRLHFFEPADMAILVPKEQNIQQALRAPEQFDLIKVLKASSL